jgi:calcineurin-like phosphoesterase family protein
MSSPNIFVGSDPHFDHLRIIELCNRPFKDAEEMNEAIIAKHNAKVGKNDYWYCLGDVYFGRDPEKIKKMLARMNGYKFLILGNHDPLFKVGASKDYNLGFEQVHYYVELKAFGTKIILFHYPMITWNKSHWGSWHLHGHEHGNLPDDPNKLRIDVGVDCHNFNPLSLDEVAEIMKKKTPPVQAPKGVTPRT